MITLYQLSSEISKILAFVIKIIYLDLLQFVAQKKSGIRVSLHSLHAVQSDREKCEGLPVAPFMDRAKVTKPTAQIGFIKYVLIPLYESLCMVSNKNILCMHNKFD